MKIIFDVLLLHFILPADVHSVVVLISVFTFSLTDVLYVAPQQTIYANLPHQITNDVDECAVRFVGC